MTPPQTDLLSGFRSWKIMVPIAIGLSVTGWMIWSSVQETSASSTVFHWSWRSIFWLLVALVCVAVRDGAYMLRIQLLTDNQLNWKRSLVVVLLWEFFSAVTPSVVGGSVFAFYIISREGIPIGRATAIMFSTLFLDELFFTLLVPLVLLLAGNELMFSFLHHDAGGLFGLGVYILFWIAYGIIALWTAFLAWGLFINPHLIRNVILKAFSLPVLRKKRAWAEKSLDEMVESYRELKGKGWMFWIKGFAVTCLSWTARYLVINCILEAFRVDGLVTVDHLLVWARQICMWIIMLVSVTPGSSGAAEYVFTEFLSGFFVAGFGPWLSLLWRLLTYYLYLIIGTIILPRWVRNKVIEQRTEA